MSTGINSGSSSHPELLSEIDRLKIELQVLQADLSTHKHISDRAIHYKHQTRRRTIQRNILALVVLLLITCLVYLLIARPAASDPPEGIPNTDIEALVPDGESSEDE